MFERKDKMRKRYTVLICQIFSLRIALSMNF
jgi:hypothetical protein